MNDILAVIFIFVIGLLISGCSRAGLVAIPELQVGDRIVIQYDRAERSLEPIEERKNRGS